MRHRPKRRFIKLTNLLKPCQFRFQANRVGNIIAQIVICTVLLHISKVCMSIENCNSEVVASIGGHVYTGL